MRVEIPRAILWIAFRGDASECGKIRFIVIPLLFQILPVLYDVASYLLITSTGFQLAGGLARMAARKAAACWSL